MSMPPPQVELLPLAELPRQSLTDQVYNILYSKVLTLELPPKTKMSEAEIARQLGVSRQAVRDAFYRLSTLGFLVIRPQRATEVSQIAARDILEARFIRTAIESATVREACRALTDAGAARLDREIEDQVHAVKAGDFEAFHNLDNQFHRMICDLAGVGFAWKSIEEQKAHTDRVRYLSLSFAAETALDGHVEILAAIKAQDEGRAIGAIQSHLSRIHDAIDTLRAEREEWFVDE